MLHRFAFSSFLILIIVTLIHVKASDVKNAADPARSFIGTTGNSPSLF